MNVQYNFITSRDKVLILLETVVKSLVSPLSILYIKKIGGFGIFWANFFGIPIIPLNNFFYNNVILCCY